MRVISAFAAGLLFGLGLVISGMANPAKVLNFLDLAGTWDPSLAFVMAGAIAVTLPGYRMVTRNARPLFESRFHMPTLRDIDARLVSGAAIFGIGWGLGGFCPGPALTSLSLAAEGTFVFVAFMLSGMWIARLIRRDSPEPQLPLAR